MFFEELKKEIFVISEQMNLLNDGNMQDGFCTRSIEDGWLSYKGFSCGFALHLQPTYICMTFGPDSPFVGYTIRLSPLLKGQQIIWMDDNGRMRFSSAQEMARFAMEALAAKVHDYLPELQNLQVYDEAAHPNF
jgi:hypothetical protein